MASALDGAVYVSGRPGIDRALAQLAAGGGVAVWDRTPRARAT